MHGGKSAQDKATAVTTLATLLAGDPRPMHEALLDHIHTLDALARDAKLQVLDGNDTDPEALTRMLDTARLATTVVNAAARTGIMEKALKMREKEVRIEAAVIAAVIETTLHGLLAWLTAIGMPQSDLDALKRSVAFALRDALEAASEAFSTKKRGPDGKPILPPSEPPSGLDHLVIVSRAELEALRDASRRNQLAIDSKPAQTPARGHVELSQLLPIPASATNGRRPYVPRPPFYTER